MIDIRVPIEAEQLVRFGLQVSGKTWNHPVPVGDVLLVRNGEETATYRLPHRPLIRST